MRMIDRKVMTRRIINPFDLFLTFQMVETATQSTYTLNVTTTNSDTIDGGGSSNDNGNGGDTSNDFNLIAANCNTNVCFYCQKTFTNVYNCRRHIR